MIHTRILKEILINIGLALLWLAFLGRHISYFWEARDVPTLFFMIMESLVVIMLLVRRLPDEVSSKVSDWVIAVTGTFFSVLFRPVAYSVLASAGGVLIISGTILAIVSYMSLNRSFGIIPANRGIKQSGLYRIVRHPMYTSYIIMYLGYVLLHSSISNASILALLLVFMVMRILREEKLLCRSKTYQNYVSRVRFRVVPYVF